MFVYSTNFPGNIDYHMSQSVNPLYTGGLFHCYMLDESICHFRGVRSILSLSIFDGKILIANNVDPDQMPHYVASDLVLHCLPMTLLRVSRQQWVLNPSVK